MRLEHFLLTAELTFPVSVFMSEKGKIRVCNSTLWIPCSSGTSWQSWHHGPTWRRESSLLSSRPSAKWMSHPGRALLDAAQNLLCACSLRKLVQAESERPISIGQESIRVAQDWEKR